MMPLILAVFAASLMGSLHCAGMCGAFVAFAVTGGIDRSLGAAPRSRLPLHLAYHGGRLLTYTTLGAIAGSLGAAFDLAGELAGAGRIAAMLAGGMMALFGSIALLRLAGVRLPKAPVPRVLRTALERGHRFAARREPVARALLTGLLTTLLPCGWLYAFVITSAGTAHPATGALTMAAFWAGTVPMLAALGAGAQRLAGVLGPRLPMLTAGAIVVIGIVTVFNRGAVALDVAALHASLDAGAGQDTVILDISSLDPSKMPCCREHAK